MDGFPEDARAAGVFKTGPDIIAMTPSALRRMATAALQANDAPRAIDGYKALIDTGDAVGDDWYNLAYLQRSIHHFDDANESYARALALGIAQPEAVHVNRAAIFNDQLADTVSATRELEQALALAPDYIPAMLNLATIREDRGDLPAARSLYQRIVKTDPMIGRAIARLAMLDIQSGLHETVAIELQDRLAKGDLAPDDAGEIGFALGHALDAAQDYRRAFAAFSTANDLTRQAHASYVPAYDPGAQERLVDAIIAAFPHRTPTTGEERGAASPIFVCGMFRSGSTLAEQILDRHSRVTAGGELSLLLQMITDRMAPFPQAAADLTTGAVAIFRDAYTTQVRRLFPGHDVIVDKRPDNFMFIGIIKTLFPDARIIHTTRNVLDNALSVYFLNFDPSLTYAGDLRSIGHFYTQYRRLMRHWETIYPDAIYDLDYDELVRNPAEVIPELVEAAGLAWEVGCLTPSSSDKVVRTPTTWQVRQPLHQRSSGRWRHYDDMLDPLREALGYDPVSGSQPVAS